MRPRRGLQRAGVRDQSVMGTRRAPDQPSWFAANRRRPPCAGLRAQPSEGRRRPRRARAARRSGLSCTRTGPRSRIGRICSPGTASATWSRAHAPASSSPSDMHGSEASSARGSDASYSRASTSTDARLREAAHARPLELRREGDLEDVARRGALDDELRAGRARHGGVGLAPEDEGLRSLDRRPMLFARTQAEPADRDAAHLASLDG